MQKPKPALSKSPNSKTDIITLESDILSAQFHPRGASLAQLIYKPLNLIVTPECPNRYAPNHYLGTIVGPIANRIAQATFTLDNQTFPLDANEGKHCLHGGRFGLSEQDWQATEINDDSVTFTLDVADGDMGFAGPVRYQACYRLENDKLHINYQALSPRNNYFNLVPHFYFNLNGDAVIDRHHLWIDADYYLPVDDTLIPTGERAKVASTPLDFRDSRHIGNTAIDTNFCLKSSPNDMRDAVILSADNGVSLHVSTNQKGVQIYDARHIGRQFLAIEPQAYPNAINQADFDSPITAPHQLYQSKTIIALRC
ncbi:MAG: galactose mutarotase [Alphaproteobacteria bacterium]|nr:galactose mutarotase [Alphaproteobacteria bacterium]